MNIKITKFESNQYDMIKSWWDHYNEPCAPLEFFPDTTYILYENNKPVISAMLVITNTPICWMTAPIKNPKYSGESSKHYFNKIMNHLEKVAQDNGKTVLFTMNEKSKLINRFIEVGFNPIFKNMTFFTKEL